MPRPREKDVIGTYSPLPTQKKFHDALNNTDCQFVLYMGGVGCGKTRAAVAQGVHCSLEWPGNVGVVGRLYATDLESSTKAAYIDYLEKYGIPFEEVKSERLIKIFNPTVKPSLVYFWPLEESARLGSKEIGWVHIEEAAELRDDQAFVRLKHRLRYNWEMPKLNLHAIRQKIVLRQRAPYKRMMFLTANPPNEDHWLANWFPEEEMVAEGKRQAVPGHLLIQANSYENRKNLPEGYIENLEQTMPDSWKRVYLLGKYGFLATGDPVYQGFKEGFHTGKLDWNRHLPVYRSWDFGRHHPAVVWSQIDNNGRWFILREYMGTDIILPDFINVIKARSAEWFPRAHFQDCCDIAGSQVNDKTEKTSIQMLEEAGIQPVARRSSPKVGGPDITKVQAMLSKLINGKPALMVDESCITIIRGFSGGYYIEKPADGRQMGDVEPKKEGFYEHLMDCVRYTAANFLESERVKASRGIEIAGPRWGW